MEKINIDYIWEDCSIGFICPHCGADLSVDSQNEPAECDCGLRYSLTTKLNIEMPLKGLPGVTGVEGVR
jgi:DNA-directed RNA polymerase subunit RPC12/RpoP